MQAHWGTFQAHAVCNSGAPHTFLGMTAGREAGQTIGIINSKSDICAGQWNSPGIWFVYFSSAFGTFSLYRRRPGCVANTLLGVSTKRNFHYFEEPSSGIFLNDCFFFVILGQIETKTSSLTQCFCLLCW